MEHITLVYTTDLHGFIVADKYFQNNHCEYGLVNVSTELTKIRKEGQECIFFDNGDLFSGSLMSLRFADDIRFRNPVISIMNDLDCKFSVLGNHEFDFGRGYLDKIFKESKFSWLSANVMKKSGIEFTGSSYHMHTTNSGRKLAFIGVTILETNDLINKDDKKGLTFLKPVDILKKNIAAVKKLGAEFICVVYHGGYDSGVNYWRGTKDTNILKAEIPQKFPRIDLFVTGHSHGCIANKLINKVHTIQAGCNGLFLGRIDINFYNKKKKIYSKVISVRGISADKKLLIKYEKYFKSTDNWLDKVVANSIVNYKPVNEEELLMKSSRISCLIHQSIQDQSKCDISVIHLWDIQGWGKGKVKRKQLINLMPDNDLYILSIFGKDIKLALERTAENFNIDKRGQCRLSSKIYEYDIWAGINYQIDVAKPLGSRVCYIKIEKKEISMRKRYSLAIYHFRSSGSLGYDMFNKYRPIWKSKNTIRDYFFSYIKQNFRLKVKLKDNFSVVKNGEKIINPKFKS